MTAHLLLTTLVAAGSSKSKSSGSSYLPIIFLIVIFGALYLLILRPRQKRMRAQQTQAREITVGSEVMSVGGIMGTVVAMTDETFDVQVANGVVLTFIRRAVNPRPAGTGGTETSSDLPPDPWDAPPDDDDVEGSAHPGEGEEGEDHGKESA